MESTKMTFNIKLLKKIWQIMMIILINILIITILAVIPKPGALAAFGCA